MAAAELLEGVPGAFRHGGDAHLDEHLVGTEARGQVGLEELGSPECPLTARPPRHHGALERRQDRRILGGGIGVGEAAADGPARADREVAHERGRLGQEGQPLSDDGGELDRPLARHGPEPHVPVVLADVGEARDRVQVDEGRGPGHAEVHERHQALAAGQELGLASVAREQGNGLLHGRGPVIVEPYRLHGRGTPLACLARSISSQSRVGDMGSSVIRTPSGPSASLTAFAIAAGTVMELDSPSPLEPSGVSGEGETTCAMSMTGASEAVGTR